MFYKILYTSIWCFIFNVSFLHAESMWSDIEKKARGQTVDFTFWGKDSESRKNHMGWIAQEMERRYGVHVHTHPRGTITQNDQLTDVFELVDGPDFKRLKQKKRLLRVDHLIPNWKYLDTSLPIKKDHGELVDGLAIPFAMNQLTFMTDLKTPKPSKDIHDFLRMATEAEGKISYPDARYWPGITFLKQALYELMPHSKIMQQPVDPKKFEEQTQVLWTFLDQLHPYLWRQGKEFPKNNQEMEQLHEQGALVLSMTNNPSKVGAFFHQGRKNVASSAYGHSAMVTTFSRIGVHAHSKVREGALVLANFMISPEAQAKGAEDFKHGAHPSVLDPKKVPAAYQNAIASSKRGMTRSMPEFDATWDEALSKEWASRYKRAHGKHVVAIPEAHYSWDKALSEAWRKRYGAVD